MAAEAPKYQNMPEWACLVEGELLGDKYISKKKKKKRKKKLWAYLLHPARCPIPVPTLPYPSLGPSAVSPVLFSAFSTSRGRWCVVVTARCCGCISAIVAVSLTRRGGGDWGRKVREGGGPRGTMVVVMEECWLLMGLVTWRVSCHVIRPSGLNKMHNFVDVPTSSLYILYNFSNLVSRCFVVHFW